MSDLSIYELEDIIWDEFGQSDDHIVPHYSDENANEHASQGDSRKKPRLDVNGVSTIADDKYAANCFAQEKEETIFSTINKPNNTMSGKDPWSDTPDNMLSASCDNDPIFSGTCTAVDSNSYNYPMTHISQADDDLGFIANDHEDKESGDLLYYGWSDIGIFEDVDRMFRSCDSSYGLGSTGNEDEMGWFSTSAAIEGPEDALKSNFKFTCPDSNALTSISENLESSKLENGSSSVNDSSMKSASISYKASPRLSEIDEPSSLSHLSFLNGSNQISESKDVFILNDQGVDFNGKDQSQVSNNNHSENDNKLINFHEKQRKHKNQKEGKRKDKCVGNGVSLRHIGDLQKKDTHLSSRDSSHKVISCIGVRQQKQNLGPDSFSYLHTSIPCMKSNYHQPLDQTTVSPLLSGNKSENNELTSLSPKECSYASNQVQPLESSHDLAFEASLCDPDSIQTGNESEIQSDVEGVSVGVPAELGSLKVKESSSISSGLNELSLEATSFRQLQQVTKKLDLRTKLCIRDSLYRLARSAEQRHNYANLNGSHEDDRDTSGALFTEGRNKCTGFMDIETDTNPIDRSIAHLLFHRPSDLSVMPAPDALALKSHTMIPGSVTSPPKTEKLSRGEESAMETDRKGV